MNYMIPYKRKPQYININDLDTALNITDYGVSAAGVLGVDTTPVDMALFAGQTIRFIADPYSVKKPINEIAKLAVSGVSIIFGEATGKKRTASAIDLIAKGFIDLTIKE